MPRQEGPWGLMRTHQIYLPDADWGAIPTKEKAEYIRQALREKLQRDGILPTDEPGPEPEGE